MASTATDDDNSAEYHSCCQYFLPCQDVHSKYNAQYSRDDRLYITVHTHQSWTDDLLAERNEKIAEECSEDYKVSKFPKLYGRDMHPGQAEDFTK